MLPDLVIVPAKPPIPGEVKTRLSTSIGLSACAELSRVMLLDMLDIHSDQEYDVTVITEWSNLESFKLLLPDIKLVPFKHEYSGHREYLLLEAFQNFLQERGKVISVFSDVPFVFPRVVREAFALLEQYDVVLGSDAGPGYYLVGLSKPIDIFTPFASVERRPYFEGTKKVCEELGLSVATVEEHLDIDTIEDISRIDWSNAREGWFRTSSLLVSLGLISKDFLNL